MSEAHDDGSSANANALIPAAGTPESKTADGPAITRVLVGAKGDQTRYPVVVAFWEPDPTNPEQQHSTTYAILFTTPVTGYPTDASSAESEVWWEPYMDALTKLANVLGVEGTKLDWSRNEFPVLPVSWLPPMAFWLWEDATAALYKAVGDRTKIWYPTLTETASFTAPPDPAILHHVFENISSSLLARHPKVSVVGEA